jgi:hypothetical protein
MAARARVRRRHLRCAGRTRLLPGRGGSDRGPDRGCPRSLLPRHRRPRLPAGGGHPPGGRQHRRGRALPCDRVRRDPVPERVSRACVPHHLPRLPGDHREGGMGRGRPRRLPARCQQRRDRRARRLPRDTGCRTPCGRGIHRHARDGRRGTAARRPESTCRVQGAARPWVGASGHLTHRPRGVLPGDHDGEGHGAARRTATVMGRRSGDQRLAWWCSGLSRSDSLSP